MRKIHIALVLAAALSTQPVFADDHDMSSSDSKPCATIVKACLKAGYTRKESSDKKFWQGCMKPILMGKTVTGVTIDSATAKDCRAHKVDKLKKELNELQ